MIVVVEGIDRVGKTTLCKRIESELGFIYFKDLSGINIPFVTTGMLKTVAYNKMTTAIEFLKLFGGKNEPHIVIDRFHLTELVYGKLKRGYFNRACYIADEVLSELFTTLIFIFADSNQCVLSNSEHKFDLDDYNNGFVEFYTKSKIDDKLLISSRDDYDFNRVIRHIRKKVNECES